MLQQTQVVTVVPYFLRFLKAFPTIAALAAAPEREVLRHWEGLGYYRRARDLHRGAHFLAAQHAARLPNDPQIFGRVPGVGRYTLGAVLSQAFDRRLPIVEANSQRLLCRFFGWRQDPRSNPVRNRLWQTAQDMLPARNVGEHNQALMELGALVCTPARPSCHNCPLRTRCQAHLRGLQNQIPVRSPPPKTVAVSEVAVVLWQARRVLVVQRPDHGRWARLWEFPHGPLQKGETHGAAAARIIRQNTGLKAEIGSKLLTIRHGVTRFRITMTCLQARHRGGSLHANVYPQARWLRPVQLPDYPVSTPQRRLAQALLGA
jgi:A/G-specific adenine glycosylase